MAHTRTALKRCRQPEQTRIKSRPHNTVFKRKRYCFVPDTANVHTTTPKTISENALQSGTI